MYPDRLAVLLAGPTHDEASEPSVADPSSLPESPPVVASLLPSTKPLSSSLLDAPLLEAPLLDAPLLPPSVRFPWPELPPSAPSLAEPHAAMSSAANTHGNFP